MTDVKEVIPRPRANLPEIKLPDGDALIPRELFARDVLGVCRRTVTRLNLPTTYVGGIAYVKRDASLQIIADKATRKNQPKRGRRA